MEGRKSTFYLIAIVVAVSNCGYEITVPTFPPMAKEKGFQESEIGVIFSFYSVGMIYTCYRLGKIPANKNIILCGLFLCGIAAFGLAIVSYLDGVAFFCASCMMRLLNGVACTMVQVPAYSLTAELFPENVGGKAAQLEMFLSIGIVASPILAGVSSQLSELLSFDAYRFPYYMISAAYFGCLIMGSKMQNRQSAVVEQEIGYGKILQIDALKKVLITFVLFATSVMALRTYLVCNNNIKSVELTEGYGVSDSTADYIFIVNTLTYLSTAALLGLLKNPNYYQIFRIGLLMGSISLLIYGNQVLGIERHVSLIAFADLFRGSAVAICCCYMMPITIEIMNRNSIGEAANSFASALLPLGWAAGDLIGPILGGISIDLMSYSITAVMFSSLILILCYNFKDLKTLAKQDLEIELFTQS